MSEFLDLESQDGVRMTWNVFPGTKQEATGCVIPVASVYTPLKPIPNVPVLPYAPLRCRICRAILNPFSIVDYITKIWICPFCYQRNHFPQHYASISEDNLPAELFPQYTTIEYESSPDTGPSVPPVFLFVLDTCMIEEELVFLKSALAQAIELLPEKSLVGLITFGTYVQVHELGFGQMPKYSRGQNSKVVRKEQILEQMNFFARKPRPLVGVIAGSRDGLSAESIARFMLHASECEFVLSLVAERLSFIEQIKLERERQQKWEEKEEIRRLRKELVLKAQPMPYFDRPFVPKRSTRPRTVPKEPRFHVRPMKSS